MGGKGSSALGGPLDAWHMPRVTLSILSAALGGKGLRSYSADKAAELREAKYFLRGHTAGRSRVDWTPVCLTLVSVSFQSPFLGATEVGNWGIGIGEYGKV